MKLKLRFLSKMRFSKMSIQCADNCEILLHYWIYLEVKMKNIWKQIQCFVISHTQAEFQFSEKLSFLLNLFWLFTVNVIIYICDFKIEVDNSTVKEKSHAIVDLELIFCWDHNLLMYSKAILALSTEKLKNSNNNSFSSDNLSDVENLNF